MPTPNAIVFRSIRAGLFAAIAVLATSPAAFALDPEAFVSRMEALLTSYGLAVDLGPATLKGDKVRVEGFTGRILSDPESKTLTVSMPVTFSAVQEVGGGSYHVGEMLLPDVAYADGDTRINVGKIRFTDLIVPGGTPASPVDLVRSMGGFSAGPMVFSTAGAEVIRVDTITSANSFQPEQSAPDLQSVGSTFTLAGLHVDLTTLPRGEGDAIVQALGLMQLDGQFTETVDWALTNGDLSVSEFALDIANQGRLEMNFALSGYTLSLLNSIYQASEQLNAINPETDPDKHAAAQQALGMSILAQLSVKSFALRYEDHSFANKLLNVMAAGKGTTEDMRQGLKTMAQEWLTGLNSPEISRLASGPISSFLDNPQSFSVSVAPTRPLSFIELVGLAQVPGLLLQNLQLQITAND